MVAAFCEHLRAEGWVVDTEVKFCDVLAERDGRRVYAEAKGRTSSPGLDVDTMFGQLLRRMPEGDDPPARYAVVVPVEARAAVLRVPARVREQLRIDAFTVDSDGLVSIL